MKLKVHLTFARLPTFFLLAACALPVIAEDPGRPVKLSHSGICIERGAPSYSSTIQSKAFNTLEECVQAGGHPRKAKQNATASASKSVPGTPSIPSDAWTTPPTLYYVIGSAVIGLLLLASFFWMRQRRRRSQKPPGTDGAELFQALLGGEQPRSAGATKQAAHRSASGWTAANLLEATQRLQAANAQWPAILSALNPQSDGALGKSLLELRGPHMFAPNVALNAIADGAERALKANTRASALDALRESLRRTNTVVRGGLR